MRLRPEVFKSGKIPMNGVLGLTEPLLETRLDAYPQPFVETLLTIINDILDFSKIETGKPETEMLDDDLFPAGGRADRLAQPDGPGLDLLVQAAVVGRRPPAAAAPPHPTQLNGRRALVVDDNANQREILQHRAEASGMRLDCAADGFVALDRQRAAVTEGALHDIALINMKMPGLDGLALATAERAAELAGRRLVIKNSLHSKAKVSRAREAGISAYLFKPVRRHELYRAMALARQAGGGAQHAAGVGLPRRHRAQWPGGAGRSAARRL